MVWCLTSYEAQAHRQNRVFLNGIGLGVGSITMGRDRDQGKHQLWW